MTQLYEAAAAAGERIDRIGFGTLRLIQKPEDFCYGVDAVLLADFAAGGCRGGGNSKGLRIPGEDSRIMDLGTGTGIVPLILSHKTASQAIFGLELQEDSWERACRNVTLNGLKDRVQMLCGSVADPLSWRVQHAEESGKQEPSEPRATGAEVQESSNAALIETLAGTFDVVTTNPPYMKGACGLTSENRAKMTARHETDGTLEDFLRSAARLLREKGDFYMVHRPHRLVDICELCRACRLEPKELRLVSPLPEAAANILLLHCVRGGGRELRVLPQLSVYDRDGAYSPELLRCYERDGADPVQQVPGAR